jgi:hypothetical protein
MAFSFAEAFLDELLEHLLLMFSGARYFGAKATIVNVLHADFALMEMARCQFKPHTQFLPDHWVARANDKKAFDADVLYQAWEARALVI